MNRLRHIASSTTVLAIWSGFFSLSGLAQRTITVDASKLLGLHSSTPLMTVGAGRANEGLRADWQQQLATVQAEIGFKYLRFHGLLHDDMGVYFEDSAGNPVYNFQYLDQLYDAMLALHIRPFVELSFMPSKLASGTKTIFWWKGNVSPPKDMGKWNGLIRALIEHWRARYGDAEINQWYYEVWNEPDLADFWSGTQQQYFDLYRNTAETIKSVCPQCRVGGPASANSPLEIAWQAYIKQSHAPADFESTHTYGVSRGNLDADGHAGTLLSASPGSIVQRVSDSRALVDAAAKPMELHYTEWSTSYTPTDPIHDQYISAAFILEKLRQVSPLTQSMSYWTFTDIFEENGPRTTPFHGGFGLMNYQGIRKPSYFAYKFLAQLQGDDIATSDPQSWATRQNNDVQALLWNYTPTIPPNGETDQIFFKREQPAKPAGTTTLNLNGLHDGRYTMAVYRTGYQQNDAYSSYVAMGSPAQLTREQVAILQSKASGEPAQTREITVSRHSYHCSFELHENDTVLVTLKQH